VTHSVSVVVAATGFRQQHVGLLLSSASGEEFIHLAWHRLLQSDSVHGLAPRSLSLLDLDGDRAIVVQSVVRLLARSNPEAPYGFDFPNEVFDADSGKWLLGSTGHGLTCASFVIAALMQAGINLLELSSWKERDEDEAWRQKIIKLLERRYPEHAAQLVANPQSVRFRPEDVGGSARMKESAWPVTFSDAVRLGEDILEELRPAPPRPPHPPFPCRHRPF